MSKAGRHIIARVLMYVLCVPGLALLILHCNNTFLDPLDPSVHPEVVSTEPAAGSVGPYLHLNYYSGGYYPLKFLVRFNKLIEPGSFTDKSVRVEGFNFPAYGYGISGYYSQDFAPRDVFMFTIYGKPPGESFPKYEVGRQYTVVFDTTIRDISGLSLREYRFSYTPEPRIRIVRIVSGRGDTVSTSTSPITVLLNSPVDPQVGVASLSIQPAVAGHWSATAQTGPSEEFTFQPSAPYVGSMTYEVRVDPGLHDIHGNAAPEGLRGTFHTPSFSIISWSLSRASQRN